MTDSIPDLWSSDIQVRVLTPLAILRAQASLLRRKTQGLVEAVVDTRTSKESIRHHLDLIAPAVNGYRERMLTATHSPNRVYPVTVAAECFFPKGGNAATLLAAIIDKLPENERIAGTQDDFIKLVKEVLQSLQVRGAIESLIAQSNEAKSSEAVPLESAGQPSGEQDA
jgi:hypothetical protein